MKNHRFVLTFPLAFLLWISLHPSCAAAATGKGGTVSWGTWMSGTPYRFTPDAVPREYVAFKVNIPPADVGSGKRDSSDRHGKPGMALGPMQLMERIPYLRSALSLKEKVTDRVVQRLENPDQRLFFPILHADQTAQDRGSRKSADHSGDLLSSSDRRRSVEKAQERYFIGLRLSPRATRQQETWFFGLGWKSGQGGKRLDRKDSNKAGTIIALPDPNQNAVKREFAGPILGFVGQF